MVQLAVENLSFSYGSHAVLRDISFTANPGDLIAVMGPNGVGKSTLFRCILGFLRNYDGRVLVDGVDTRTLSRKHLAQRVAYIPQASAQVFDYTVLELVLMGMATQLHAFQMPAKAEKEQALAVLEQLGIGHLAHRGCGQISGGEYQLVLLARTLVQKACILIMDEPTANLDYGNQFRVMERIAGLSQRDFIVLTSTHDPNQVLLHATRALVVEGGTVSADGAPQDVLTAETLSRLYGIAVRRHAVNDAGRSVHVCIPARTKDGDVRAGNRGVRLEGDDASTKDPSERRRLS